MFLFQDFVYKVLQNLTIFGFCTLCMKGYLKQLDLTNFQTYTDASFVFTDGLNFICAPNGSGKSTIVNALCFLCLGNAKMLNRNVDLVNYVKFGENSCVVKGIFVTSKGEKTVKMLVRILGDVSGEDTLFSDEEDANMQQVLPHLAGSDTERNRIGASLASLRIGEESDNESSDFQIVRVVGERRVEPQNDITVVSHSVQRSRPTRPTTSCRFFLNDKPITRKELKVFYDDNNINVSSLTNFLPQERVAEFVKMTGQQIFNTLFNTENMFESLIETIKERENKLSNSSAKLDDLLDQKNIFEKQVKELQTQVDKIKEKATKELKLAMLKNKKLHLVYNENLHKKTLLKDEIKLAENQSSVLSERLQIISAQILELESSEDVKEVAKLNKNIFYIGFSTFLIEKYTQCIKKAQTDATNIDVDVRHLYKKQEKCIMEIDHLSSKRKEVDSRLNSLELMSETEFMNLVTKSSQKHSKSLLKSKQGGYTHLAHIVNHFLKIFTDYKKSNPDSAKKRKKISEKSFEDISFETVIESATNDTKALDFSYPVYVENKTPTVFKELIHGCIKDYIYENTSKKQELRKIEHQYTTRGKEIQSALEKIEKERLLDDQRLSKLKELSLDCYKAVMWIKENQGFFGNKVLLPAFLSLKITDFLIEVESALSTNSLLSFICLDHEVFVRFTRIMKDEKNFKISAIELDETIMRNLESHGARNFVDCVDEQENEHFNTVSDDFGGIPNSQFQKDSTNTEFSADSEHLKYNPSSQATVFTAETITVDPRLPSSSVSRDTILKEGFSGYVIDFISARIEHKILFCNLLNLHNIPVSQRDMDVQKMFQKYDFRKMLCNHRYFEHKKSKYSSAHNVTIENAIKARNLFKLQKISNEDDLKSERSDLHLKMKDVLRKISDLDEEKDKFYAFRQEIDKLYMDYSENIEVYQRIKENIVNIESRLKLLEVEKNIEPEIKNLNTKKVQIETFLTIMLNRIEMYLESGIDFAKLDAVVDKDIYELVNHQKSYFKVVSNILNSTVLDSAQSIESADSSSKINKLKGIVLAVHKKAENSNDDSKIREISGSFSWLNTKNEIEKVFEYLTFKQGVKESLEEPSSHVKDSVAPDKILNHLYIYKIFSNLHSINAQISEKRNKVIELKLQKSSIQEDIQNNEHSRKSLQFNLTKCQIDVRNLKKQLKQDSEILENTKADFESTYGSKVSNEDAFTSISEIKPKESTQKLNVKCIELRKSSEMLSKSSGNQDSQLKQNKTLKLRELSSDHHDEHEYIGTEKQNDTVSSIDQGVAIPNLQAHADSNDRESEKLDCSLNTPSKNLQRDLTYTSCIPFTFDDFPITIPELEREIYHLSIELQYLKTDDKSLKDYQSKSSKLHSLQKDTHMENVGIEGQKSKILKLKNKLASSVNLMVQQIDEKFDFLFSKIGCEGRIHLNACKCNTKCWHNYNIEQKDSSTANNTKNNIIELIEKGIDMEHYKPIKDWKIDILVRYRTQECLNLLCATRQSGGEKSVATMLFLISILSITQSMFKIVDEINQGMDKIYERKMLEIITEIYSCKKNDNVNPQLFIITPKVLDNLNYRESNVIVVYKNVEADFRLIKSKLLRHE